MHGSRGVEPEPGKDAFVDRSRRAVRTVRPAAVIVVVAAAVLASSRADQPHGPHFERVGTESGPPPEVITAVLRDRTGFVWIGSRDGLTRYDGHSFEVYEFDPADPASMSDNAIRTIYEDRDGNLWIGTNTGGLNRLDRATWRFRHYRHDSADPGSLSHDSVYSILHDSKGDLWVGTQQGLNRLDRETGKFERFRADPNDPGSISHDYVFTLHEDGEGRLWIGTFGGGLNVRDPGTGEFRSYRHDPADERSLNFDGVFAIHEDESGALWIGTSRGLNRFDRDRETFERYEPDADDPSSLSDPLVTSLAAGPAGKLWVGTHGGGLNELDPSRGTLRAWRHEVGRRNSLSDDDVVTLHTDADGTLWIGTWGGGLNRLSTTSLLITGAAGEPPPPEDLSVDDVTSLATARDGGLWLGTRSGDLVRRDPDAGSFRRLRGLSRTILGLHEDRDSGLWIGTNNGLMRMDLDTGEITEHRHDPTDPTSLGPGYVKAILEDRDGGLWVGTGEGGLHLVDDDGGVVERFVHDPLDPDSLSDDYITALYEDAGGRLWVGTRSGGVNIFDRASGRAVRYAPDPEDDTTLSHHYVTSVVEDVHGRLWVGTGGGGVNRVVFDDDGRVERYERHTTANGLIDDDVMSVLPDDDGTLWLSTKGGLSRFDPDSGYFSNLYVADGLSSAEFEPGSAARLGDKLYFGSVKWLTVVPVGTEFPTPAASPTVITSLRTPTGELRGDRPAWELENVEIPYGEWLSIETAVLDYNPVHHHAYAYRLGRKEEWIDLGSRRAVTFTDLDPGAYTFSIKARNCQGVWSTASPTLQIRVVPPFWMTPWFRAAAVLAVIALAAVGHQVRLSAVERRNRELVALHEQREKARSELGRAYDRLRHLTRRLEAVKEDERQHIARELHDELGPSLTAVIINLQLLAEKADPENSGRRIGDTIELVDRLVDRVRDLSLDLRPPLLDELGLVPALRGYLEAQAKRARIEIDVSGDATVEGLSHEAEITAFRVVQEAVTNVIRHAGALRVTVEVKQRDGHLDLNVRDDGRGFDVRATIDGSAGGALGLLGMQERVQMLGGKLDIDSVPGRGTGVRVRIPVGVVVAP